jgi:hypothetical protein
MPSGSTRLTVTFLYSFPSIVLKSSPKTAADAKNRIENASSFIFLRPATDWTKSTLGCREMKKPLRPSDTRSRRAASWNLKNRMPRQSSTAILVDQRGRAQVWEVWIGKNEMIAASSELLTGVVGLFIFAVSLTIIIYWIIFPILVLRQMKELHRAQREIAKALQ